MALSQTVRAVRTSTVALLDDEEEQPRLLRSIFKNVHAEGGQCKSIYSWGVSPVMAANMTLFQPTPGGGAPNPQFALINLFSLIKRSESADKPRILFFFVFIPLHLIYIINTIKCI